MDAFITWFRATLELRFAAAWAANGEEDFDVFEAKRDAYFARHAEDARSSIFCDREDDDDISFLALNLESMKVAAFFAAIRHPGDRYTALTSTEKDSGHGLVPAIAYHVARMDGDWMIVGEGGYGGGAFDHERGEDFSSLAVEEVVYLDEDRLAEGSDFVGSIAVG